ncbi:MAG: hypothetical protein AB7R89_16330 [Dehalococcoidia bacterium]
MIQTLTYDSTSNAYRQIPASIIPARYRPVLPAFVLYRSRTLRRSHPEGTTDKGGRWYPVPEERRDCCTRIRTPSRAWPWSLLVHCRTAGHIATLLDVEPRLLRGLILWLANYCRDTTTAPVNLCGVCGASWPCEHRSWWTPATDDPNLIEVPSARADMTVHLGGMNR